MHEDEQEHLRNSNIYLILKRPRISFAPGSIEIRDELITGKLSIQKNENITVKTFVLRSKIPEEVRSVLESPFPHTKLMLTDSNGELYATYPIVYLLRFIDASLNGVDDFEVMYIGQAFGKSGERTAVKRLTSHSTLQKILSDINDSQPNDEIFLALYQFEFHRFISTMHSPNTGEISGKEDEEHYEKILDSEFNRSMRVSLAEAALIRYFQPRYNKVYVSEFPKKRMKILKKLYDFDFAGLTVEISVEDHRTKIFSSTQKPSDHHMAHFDLDNSVNRKMFFFDIP